MSDSYITKWNTLRTVRNLIKSLIISGKVWSRAKSNNLSCRVDALPYNLSNNKTNYFLEKMLQLKLWQTKLLKNCRIANCTTFVVPCCLNYSGITLLLMFVLCKHVCSFRRNVLCFEHSHVFFFMPWKIIDSVLCSPKLFMLNNCKVRLFDHNKLNSCLQSFVSIYKFQQPTMFTHKNLNLIWITRVILSYFIISVLLLNFVN